MQYLDVCRKCDGRIWHRKPSPSNQDGIIVQVCHSVLDCSVTYPSRTIRFLYASFDRTGEQFIAADHHGNIFAFNLNTNWFTLVKKAKIPPTALAYTLKKKSEFLVAMANYSLHCYDTETKELVAEMKGHQTAINNISVHASGKFAITVSVDDALLWNLEKFQQLKKLSINENICITEVFFLPLSNIIITCFKDDSIFGWDLETLSCKFELPIPPGKKTKYKTLASTRSGRTLAAAGHSRFISLFALDTHTLFRVIELPSKVTIVKQLVFLSDSFDKGSNKILGALCQDGIARFMDIHSCKLLFDIGTIEDRIHSIASSLMGKHLIGLMDSGNMNIYSLPALTSELNKPPPPVVKAVRKTKSFEESIKSCYKSSDKPSSDSSEDKDLDESIDKDRLYRILKGHGEYPEKYRFFIWRQLLKLPENHTAYAALVDKGNHSSFITLQEYYPVKSQRLFRLLQRVLSALAHWSPILAETKYLPALVFPFLKVFYQNHLCCFEIVATFIINWCGHWFEYFPNPPINILGMIENVLSRHDPTLLRHLIKYKVTSQIYAWPLLESLFTEVLTKNEWLRLWDHVFSNHPAFLLMVVVAYVIGARAALLKCVELDDFKFFFSQQNAVNIGNVIKETYRLISSTPDEVNPLKLMNEFVPLTKGQYPVFNKYPKFIVDYQKKEREKIQQQELEYLRQRQLSLELHKATLHRQQEEEAWFRQQKLLLEAEDKRRKMMKDEEEKLTERRRQLQTMNKEAKVKQLNLLDDVRHKFLSLLRKQHEIELHRLNDQVSSQESQRVRELEDVISESEMKKFERELEKRLYEQETLREYIQTSNALKSDGEISNRHAELESRIMECMVELLGDKRHQEIVSEKVRKDILRNSSKLVPADVEKCDLETEKENQPDNTYDIDRDKGLDESLDITPNFCFSKERHRIQTETKFMNEIRQLRQRLARESYQQKPPS
ncbi:TBC1 domain family member 31-like [Octopus sinensis]|uniref:TBC1 domain family member 31 n=1 Tax=Octopus sinensis TaxID=2607531 RepID=A0A6P7SH07_9MOLL|nr:TBC1 domain family member 31-like [Octopus sinensis]